MTNQAKNKPDIFELLGHIDRQNAGYLKGLPEEERKGFAPIVTLRWLSGSGDAAQLLNVNELVNSTVFNLHKHPDLLFKLMIIATPPKKHSYRYLKPMGKIKVTKRLDVIKRFLGVSTRDANDFVPLYSPEDILEMSEELGDDADFIKQLKSEIK